MTILDLFLTFAKIGLFTFGGGYAMIALIEDICVEKKQWITPDEMMNVTVIAESTPGPIAINCATYVGYKKKGLSGAAVATIGMVLPSFCIIFLISMFLDNFLDITWIAHAFMGIKVAVGILILDAGIKMIRKMQKTNVHKRRTASSTPCHRGDGRKRRCLRDTYPGGDGSGHPSITL
jgi:chromate transporter